MASTFSWQQFPTIDRLQSTLLGENDGFIPVQTEDRYQIQLDMYEYSAKISQLHALTFSCLVYTSIVVNLARVKVATTGIVSRELGNQDLEPWQLGQYNQHNNKSETVRRPVKGR